MDREPELQFLGFFGIFKESFKILFSWRKIFSQITLTIILPLSFIFLAHIQISQLLFFRILDNEITLDDTDKNTSYYAKLSHDISSEWTAFWLFKAAYFTFVLILSLLATSAVVYTIACIYTAKEITFKKVMSVVPRVWKRLILTFLWNFAVVLVYNVVAGAVIFLWARFIGTNTFGIILIAVLLTLYLVGIVYISVVWHLASVVSVLEDACGIKAMIKSKGLIEGKLGVAVSFFILLSVSFIGIGFVFGIFVVPAWIPNLGIRVVVGILCCLLLFKLILFGLVVQTVIYFVCKSYHHERIDKPSLADHLELYLGKYVPLKWAKDVQLGTLPA
ncbi:hypothetical protein CJ030_MR6G010854 [Morella rubra]|uniref:Uncharacterized protein n=1 Tax=Morella rubra TaxID=262757 RepID=A0A6A1VFG8_9ROSI|nr:hypothetical protein CJ030_MR6G010854 [Morella rubra]